MNRRLILLTIYCLTIASCRKTEESNEVMEQAMEVYLFSEPSDSIKVDSSLVLTNKALDLDNQNIQAYNHKTTLLLIKRDIEGMLETVDELIKLRPEKPLYLGQKAICLELQGDLTAANRYYEKALNKYQEYLINDSLNFDLMMEYVGFLESSGDTILASRTLTRMKNRRLEDYQKEIIDRYKEQSVSKEQLIKYWKGEIGYEQLGEE